MAENEGPRKWHSFLLTYSSVEFVKEWFESHPNSGVEPLSISVQMNRTETLDKEFTTEFQGKDELAGMFTGIYPRITGPRTIYVRRTHLLFKTLFTPEGTNTITSFINDCNHLRELCAKYPPAAKNYYINKMEVLLQLPEPDGTFNIAQFTKKKGIPKSPAVKEFNAPYQSGDTLIPVELTGILLNIKKKTKYHKGKKSYVETRRITGGMIHNQSPEETRRMIRALITEGLIDGRGRECSGDMVDGAKPNITNCKLGE
jgi:hypothetical protein